MSKKDIKFIYYFKGKCKNCKKGIKIENYICCLLGGIRDFGNYCNIIKDIKNV